MYMSVADTSTSFCEVLTCVDSKLLWTLINCVLDHNSKEPLRRVSCDVLRHCIQFAEHWPAAVAMLVGRPVRLLKTAHDMLRFYQPAHTPGRASSHGPATAAASWKQAHDRAATRRAAAQTNPACLPYGLELAEQMVESRDAIAACLGMRRAAAQVSRLQPEITRHRCPQLWPDWRSTLNPVQKPAGAAALADATESWPGADLAGGTPLSSSSGRSAGAGSGGGHSSGGAEPLAAPQHQVAPAAMTKSERAAAVAELEAKLQRAKARQRAKQQARELQLRSGTSAGAAPAHGQVRQQQQQQRKRVKLQDGGTSIVQAAQHAADTTPAASCAAAASAEPSTAANEASDAARTTEASSVAASGPGWLRPMLGAPPQPCEPPTQLPPSLGSVLEAQLPMHDKVAHIRMTTVEDAAPPDACSEAAVSSHSRGNWPSSWQRNSNETVLVQRLQQSKRTEQRQMLSGAGTFGKASAASQHSGYDRLPERQQTAQLADSENGKAARNAAQSAYIWPTAVRQRSTPAREAPAGAEAAHSRASGAAVGSAMPQSEHAEAASCMASPSDEQPDSAATSAGDNTPLLMNSQQQQQQQQPQHHPPRPAKSGLWKRFVDVASGVAESALAFVHKRH